MPLSPKTSSAQMQFALEQKEKGNQQASRRAQESQQGRRFKEQVARLKEPDGEIEAWKKQVQEVYQEYRSTLNLLGNAVHPSVPVNKNEAGWSGLEN